MANDRCRAGIARQGWGVRTLSKHRRDACATDLKDLSSRHEARPEESLT